MDDSIPLSPPTSKLNNQEVVAPTIDNDVMPSSLPIDDVENNHPLAAGQGVTSDEKDIEELGHADESGKTPIVVPNSPKVNIKILVISGQTHMYSFEPETTIGRVKELIWNMWPTEWTKEPALPATPSYFRLLYLGRLLADEQTLSGLGLKLEPNVTIVHLSVRTFPISEDDGPKKSILPFSLARPLASRGNSAIATSNSQNGQEPTQTRRNSGRHASSRSGEEESHGGGCRCVIM